VIRNEYLSINEIERVYTKGSIGFFNLLKDERFEYEKEAFIVLSTQTIQALLKKVKQSEEERKIVYLMLRFLEQLEELNVSEKRRIDEAAKSIYEKYEAKRSVFGQPLLLIGTLLLAAVVGVLALLMNKHFIRFVLLFGILTFVIIKCT
jgi:hypothetical protein